MKALSERRCRPGQKVYAIVFSTVAVGLEPTTYGFEANKAAIAATNKRFTELRGAMGTSEQVATDKTSEGQADNRRVVVRILQNKGIAGT